MIQIREIEFLTLRRMIAGMFLFLKDIFDSKCFLDFSQKVGGN